ncbi:FAD:protein FMN transferase [Bacteroidota bacterium]
MFKLLRFVVLVFILSSCAGKEYKKMNGFIFGTTYSITYEASVNKDFTSDIQKLLKEFDSSLSTYNPSSIISKINQNQEDVVIDEYFKYFFHKSEEISQKTDGAFDITVAPLVNAWGFGFTGEHQIDTTIISGLLKLIGFKKIKMENNTLIKEDPGIMLDGSAIAKGYSVDLVAELLERKGVVNYMVEIGGEMRVKGINPEENNWRIGIDKPVENLTQREIFSVINISNIGMATSGNYRRFFIENGIKHSHTINPFTGYPAKNRLLSSTVFSSECITADAYATAFMVLGLEESIKIVEKDPDLEAYFIYSNEKGGFEIYASEAIKDLISDTE